MKTSISQKNTVFVCLNHISQTYGFQLLSYRVCPSLYKKNAAYQIQTQQGPFLVKPYGGNSQQLEAKLKRILSIQNLGYPHMAKLIQQPDGKLYTRYANQIFYVSEWVAGKQLTGHPFDCHLLGEALGKLHRLPTPERRLSCKNTLLKLRKLQAKFIDQNLPYVQSTRSDIQIWFQQHASILKKLSSETFSILDKRSLSNELDFSLSHPTWIHGDVTKPNTIRREADICLIDWEQTKIDWSLLELVKALANTTNFSPTLLISMLNGYEQEHPLNMSQKQIIAALFRLPREAWFVASQLKKIQSTSQSFSILKQSWESRLKAIKILDDWALF
ncbi:aminoglycoside phosphotransferase family protein [Alicyclobacillus tolerans]|uniref:aminoglycoside phosphotransferase family protein n=1 Tax=Alicyclobacillus tolerans TaxID=90970 RepID=UPI003B821BA1